jgi:hypothetical protein
MSDEVYLTPPKKIYAPQRRKLRDEFVEYQVPEEKPSLVPPMESEQIPGYGYATAHMRTDPYAGKLAAGALDFLTNEGNISGTLTNLLPMPGAKGAAVVGSLMKPKKIGGTLEDLQGKWLKNIKEAKARGWDDYEDVKAWRMAELIKANLKRGKSADEVLGRIEQKLKQEYETAKALRPTLVGQGYNPGSALEQGTKAMPADIYSEIRALNDFAEIKKSLKTRQQLSLPLGSLK